MDKLAFARRFEGNASELRFVPVVARSRPRPDQPFLGAANGHAALERLL